MTRLALSLLALPVLSLSLSGCHKPEITIVDRANPDQVASTPFIRGRALQFPKIDSQGQNYWVIFVDQTPCKLAAGANPKAYEGNPTNPPSCIIDFEPHGRDRLYRYALYLAGNNDHPHGPPPLQTPYQEFSSCRPYCNNDH